MSRPRWMSMGLVCLLALLALARPLSGLGLAWQCADGTPCPLAMHDSDARTERGSAGHACCAPRRSPGLTSPRAHQPGGQCLLASDDRAGTHRAVVDLPLATPALLQPVTVELPLAAGVLRLVADRSPPDAPDLLSLPSRAPPHA
ncbi:MAG TPA: hypothetical protein VGN26_06100 [Armatimonadota bacterium]|jgi:hypothetical protein